MVTWVFTYVFLGIAPLVQVRTGEDPATTLGIHHSLYGTASLIVLGGAVATLLGTAAASRAADDRLEDAETRERSSAWRTYFLSYVCLGLFTYYAYKVGPSNLFVSRTELGVIREMVWPDKTTNAMIGAGASMGLLVSMIALIHLRHQQKREGVRPAVLLPLLVLIALVACVNPISTPRYVFGTALLALLASLGLYKTLERFRLVTLSFVAGLVFVFPGLDAFRNSVSTASVQSADALTSLTTGDFDAFAQVVNTVEYVQRNGISNGNQLMGVIFFWVPRSFWPEKAVDTGTLLANMKGYWFTNLSAPLPAELFINGGWIFLISGMIVFGFLIRRWDMRLNRLIRGGWVPSILGCVMPFYMLILLRGSLLQAVAFMAVILAAAAFVSPKKTGEFLR
ncbi:hypothetical protein AB0O54_20315 [Pseudarthrobacter oxydans]|uniref:hypothetical protein n=1 Tax=Pseudarthrobacter oxydans TaxID=1671 RepID=UPI00341F809E